jgi:FtsP/CotA-like multicopper oxidase with cupredoxin domain
MAPYRDEQSPAAMASDRPDRRTVRDENEDDLEKSLLEEAERSSSEADDGSSFGVAKKANRVRKYQSTGPRTSRHRILTFFILLLLIVIVIFSQLFIESPPEGVHGGHRKSPFPVPQQPARAPQDYAISPAWDYYAPPMRRELFWTIQDVVKHPDGVYRQMMVINGVYPGPLIEVNEGDTVIVNVVNQAQNATAIHWHGIYQNGTNWMDGTVGVTQCPIPPGGNFTYEFTVDNQVGTYWYHAHHGVQAADGLVGPMVVHSRNEEGLSGMTYASDRVVMVSDHYYKSSSALLMEYLASNKENAEPTPDTALINGRGVRDCSLYPEHMCDSSNLYFPQINVSPGRRHRLRIINVGQLAEFQISLDEHSFTIMEVDGTVVRSPQYDRLNINPAQRYSIIVETNSNQRDAFWFRAKMLSKCFQDPDSRMNTEAKAVLKYGPADNTMIAVEPESVDLAQGPDLECRDMNLTGVEPLPEIEAPQPDATYYLRTNFEIGSWQLSRGVFNGSSWRADVRSPSLHRVMHGLHANDPAFTNSSLPEEGGSFVNEAAFDTKRELVIQTEGYQVIDLIISNFDDGNHPLHMHGYKFFVLAQGHGYPPDDIYETVDVRNPMRRDTASVEAYGWTMLRVIADNPGAWAFHCHVSWHSEAGLAMQLVTRSDMMAGMELPPANLDLCEAPVDQLKMGSTPDDKVFMGSS